MAAQQMSSKNFNGRWALNKELSGNTSPALGLQGVNLVKRKAISMVGITLDIKHYTDDQAVEHIDIVQKVTGNIKAPDELRVLDYQWRDLDHNLFGKVQCRSRRTDLSDLGDDKFDSFLKSGWAVEHNADGFIQVDIESAARGWFATQVWGFCEVKGDMKYFRNMIVKKGSEGEMLRMAYDYIGSSK